MTSLCTSPQIIQWSFTTKGRDDKPQTLFAARCGSCAWVGQTSTWKPAVDQVAAAHRKNGRTR